MAHHGGQSSGLDRVAGGTTRRAETTPCPFARSTPFWRGMSFVMSSDLSVGRDEPGSLVAIASGENLIEACGFQHPQAPILDHHDVGRQHAIPGPVGQDAEPMLQ